MKADQSMNNWKLTEGCTANASEIDHDFGFSL